MTTLEEIFEVKKEEVKKLRNDYSLSRFSDSIHFEKKTLEFSRSIKRSNDISVIAEIKKASPSKGIIREDFDPVKIAQIYMENEVSAISVLTDINFFKGSINYLNQIADIKKIPLLRKDFIIDEYQIFEARSNGADIILLIAELLSENQINELTHAAEELGLEVLLELHSEDELKKINFNSNKIIGINNRNLHTFEVNIENCINISSHLPDETIKIAESGFKRKEDVDKILTVNIDAVLVGEQFMASSLIGDKVKEFKEWCKREG